MYKITITNRLGTVLFLQADDYSLIGDRVIRLYDLVKGDEQGVAQLDRSKLTQIHEFISLKIDKI